MFNKGISRRSFLKGAAAGAMGIAALGLVQPVEEIGRASCRERV